MVGEPLAASQKVWAPVPAGVVLALSLMSSWLAFQAGNGAIDQEDPQVGPARGAYITSIVLGVAGLAAYPFMRAPNWPVVLAAGVVLALPVAFVIYPFSVDYNGNPDDFLGLESALAFLGLWVVFGLMVVALIVLAIIRRRRFLDRGIATFLVAVITAHIGLAVYHLATLREQADAAREAYETPLGGLIALAATLAAMAWARRRR